MKTLNTYITEKFADIDNYNVIKYELVDQNKATIFGRTVYQIRALKTFKTIDGKIVKNGDLGGYIESEANLSQEGSCWVADDTVVFDDAKVYGDDLVCDHCTIYEKVRIYGQSIICASVIVSGHAELSGKAFIYGPAVITGRYKNATNTDKKPSDIFGPAVYQ